MQVIDKGNTYKVYMLVFQNGKRYIGYTGEPDLNLRLVKGYCHNENLRNALKCYDFTIEILAENLSKKQAEAYERNYIFLYDTTNIEKGYNYSAGGASGFFGCLHTSEAKQAISNKLYANAILKQLDYNTESVEDTEKAIRAAIALVKKAHETATEIVYRFCELPKIKNAIDSGSASDLEAIRKYIKRNGIEKAFEEYGE